MCDHVSDAAVGQVPESTADGGDLLAFDVVAVAADEQTTASMTRSVKVQSQRCGDFFAQLVDGTATLPISRSGVLEALKAYIRQAHADDIRPDAVLSLKATVDGENVPLASDAVVSNLLEAVGTNAILAVGYETSSAAQSSVSLALVFNDLVGHRESSGTFRYSLSSDQLLKALKQECIHELDLPEDSQVCVSVSVEGTEQLINSDRALMELLLHHSEQAAASGGEASPLRLVVALAETKTSQIGVFVRAHLVDTLAAHDAEFTFDYNIHQENLLSALKEAVRHAFEMTNNAVINVAAVFDGEEVALPSDKSLLNTLTEFLAPGAALELTVRAAQSAAPSITLQALVSAGADSAVAEFDFTFAVDDANIVSHLRHEVEVELEQAFTERDQLVFVDDNGEEIVIASDPLLRDLAHQLAADSKPLQLIVRRRSEAAVRAPQCRRNVACKLRDETAMFVFQYTVEQENVLQSLVEDVKDELDLMPNDAVSLEAVIDGDIIPLRSDREVREVLHHLDRDDTLLLVAHENTLRNKQQSVSVVNRPVECAFEGETALFSIRYVIDQDGLLQHLLTETQHELDLMPNEKIRLSVVIGSDEAPLSTDGEARELLSLDDAAALKLVAYRVASSGAEQPQSSAPPRRRIACTLGSETAHFELAFNFSDGSIVEALVVECKDELDLMPNENLRLFLCLADGEDVALTSDGMLREVLSSLSTTDDVLTLRAEVVQAAAQRSSTAKRPIRCTFNGQTAEFDFSFSVDQENLLQSLLAECKGELDLMPSDSILLSAVIDKELAPLRSDRDLRELLSATDAAPIDLSAEHVDSSAAGSPLRAAQAIQQAITLRLDVRCGEESSCVTLRFSKGEQSILESLKQEIRGEMELEPSVALILMASVDEQSPFALRSDADVVALVLPDQLSHTVSIFVTLPKSEQQQLEEVRLNRTAELFALFYDWQDIIAVDVVEASDLKLVIGNVRYDGVALSSTDPILEKLTELANAETVLRVDDELLPYLEKLVSHLGDEDVSRFCHACRDVIEFLVSKSPAFRLRRSLSEAFRSLAVNSVVSSQGLKSVLLSSTLFDADDIETVFVGFGETLTRREYNSVLEQLFGDHPQDVVQLLVAALQGHDDRKTSEGHLEVFQLRRNRLAANVRHALDGVAAVHLVSFAQDGIADDTMRGLVWAVSCLAGGPHYAADAVQWFKESTKDEIAAYNFIASLVQFKSSSVSQQVLAHVSTAVNDPSLEPSQLLPRSLAANGLATWALSAAQLVCHHRRLLFPPPQTQLQPRPPSAKPDETPRKARGFSSPYVLQRNAEGANANRIADDQEERGVCTAVTPVERFEPRLRHLTNDLQITESKPGISLRQLTAVLPQVAERAPLLLSTAPQHEAPTAAPEQAPEPEPSSEATATEPLPEANGAENPIVSEDTQEPPAAGSDTAVAATGAL